MKNNKKYALIICVHFCLASGSQQSDATSATIITSPATACNTSKPPLVPPITISSPLQPSVMPTQAPSPLSLTAIPQTRARTASETASSAPHQIATSNTPHSARSRSERKITTETYTKDIKAFMLKAEGISKALCDFSSKPGNTHHTTQAQAVLLSIMHTKAMVESLFPESPTKI